MEGYDSVLDGLLKDRLTAKNPLIKEAIDSQTQKPGLTQAIETYDHNRPVAGQLQLVIGHVGAGKSLYMRRYKEMLLSPALRSRAHWAFIDFNNSPPSLKNAEDWLYQNFVNSFREENQSIDLDSEKTINAVFIG